MFIYKTAKFASVWTTILKIWAIFVHQSLAEPALCNVKQASDGVTKLSTN